VLAPSTVLALAQYTQQHSSCYWCCWPLTGRLLAQLPLISVGILGPHATFSHSHWPRTVQELKRCLLEASKGGRNRGGSWPRPAASGAAGKGGRCGQVQAECAEISSPASMIDWHGYSSGAARRGGKGRIRSRAVPALARTRLSAGLGGAASTPACYSTARQMGCRGGEPSGAVVVPVVRVRAEPSRLSRAVPWGRAGRRKRLKWGTWGGGLEGNRAGGREKNSRGWGAFSFAPRRPSPGACAHAWTNVETGKCRANETKPKTRTATGHVSEGSCELFAMHGSFQGQVVLDSAGAGIEALRRAKLWWWQGVELCSSPKRTAMTGPSNQEKQTIV